MIASGFTTAQLVLDRLFLARRDTNAVSSAMTGAMLFWAGFALCLFTVNYSTTFVAQYVGAGRPRRAGAAAWQAIWLASALGLGVWALAPLAGPVADFIDHPEAIRVGEALYLEYLCMAAWPLMLTGAASSFFSGLGKTHYVMLLNGVGLLVNSGVGYVLILGHFGFEPQGIAGAGRAIVWASWATAVLGLALLVGLRRHREEFGTLAGWRPDGELLRRLLRFGLPTGVQYFIDVSGFTLFILIIGLTGTTAAAATSLTFTINAVTFLPAMGLAQAVGVLVGRYQGAGRSDLAHRVTHSGLAVAALYNGLMMLPYLVFPRELAELFRPDADSADWPAVAAATAGLLGFVAAYSLADGILLVYSSALRAAGDTVFVTLILLALTGPVMVLPAYLTYRNGWDVGAAWAGVLTYIVLSTALIAARYYSGRWRSMRVIEPAVVGEE